jgi:hypothetical protein
MYDYAQSQLLGRATADAHFDTDRDGRVIKAVFMIALNTPVRRGNRMTSRTIYRRIMVLGSFADYVLNCQEEDGLRGRLINVIGVMDDEHVPTDEEDDEYYEVTRVAPGGWIH